MTITSTKGTKMIIRVFQLPDQAAVIDLWESCGLLRSWNDPRKDIRRKRDQQPEGFLVGILEEEIVATVMAGYDGHRGWVNYLATAPQHQKRGLGREMMGRAEQLLAEMGCPKLNLQVRASNTDAINFYARLGYRVDDVVSLGKRLERDDS